MTRHVSFIILGALLALAACARSQPADYLPPSTGSMVPQPIADSAYVPTGPDDGDNRDEDFAN
jgi:predicted small lipoprotein YifL